MHCSFHFLHAARVACQAGKLAEGRHDEVMLGMPYWSAQAVCGCGPCVGGKVTRK